MSLFHCNNSPIRTLRVGLIQALDLPMAISSTIIQRTLYFVVCLGLVAYFMYDYGVVTGSWVIGALLYAACLFLVFPALREVRAHGASALHWLDWTRLAFIPVFAACAVRFASWLPLLTITALGLSTSLFVLFVALWRDRSSATE